MKALIGVLILGVVGAGVYLYTISGEPAVEPVSSQSEVIEQETESIKTQEFSQTGTIEDIKSLGNVRCEYSSEYNTDGVIVNSTGIVYHAANKVRVESNTWTDLDMPSNAESFKINMILDQDTVYTWSDQTGAFTMNLSQMETFEQDMKERYGDMYQGDSSNPESLLEQSLNYECESWTVDGSKFELPSGVEFIDFFEMMEGTMQQLDGLMGQFGDMEIPIAQ
jgi:hypothetical protein